MLNHSTTRVLGLITGAALATVFGGCASVQTYPTVHTASINAQQVREFARVAEGETLTIRLPTEGGCAYGWRLAPESFNNDLVALTGRHEQRSVNGALATFGEPALDVFTFDALDAGTTTLAFVYDQRMNAEQSQLAKFWLEVNVFNARAEARAAAEAREAAEEAAQAAADAEAEAFAAADSETE
jgi:predicted secreted protein